MPALLNLSITPFQVACCLLCGFPENLEHGGNPINTFWRRHSNGNFNTSGVKMIKISAQSQLLPRITMSAEAE